MEQYHLTVNLDKREFLNPHKLGDGLKLGEQVNSAGGVMVALMALLACSNGRGGGDLEEHPIIGRWAGDRIAVVGDYAEKGDLRAEDHADIICELCHPAYLAETVRDYRKIAREARKKGDEARAREYADKARRLAKLPSFTDISDQVLPVVEAACGVKITGDGWREKEGGVQAMRPDMILVAGPREPQKEELNG